MGLKGNQYYLLRSKDGRETQYTPTTLLEKANEYFNWAIENPFKEEVLGRPWTEYLVDEDGNPILDTNKKQKTIHHPHSIVHINKMRPFTLQGFCNYAEIVKNTFKSYEKRDDFVTVCTRIRGVIENHQLEGAASGFLNPSIIARKLGLVDKREVKEDRHVSKYNTPEERRARLKQLMNKDDADS